MPKRGFTLTEIIVTLAIVSALATIAIVALGGVRVKARDTARRAQLAQIGRFLSASSCFIPEGGPGDYDLADLLAEVKAKYPAAAAIRLPTDPKTGTNAKSNYRYLVETADRCVLYANLEKSDESVTLPSITTPTVGIGSGVLRSTSMGVNGTDRFYQYSK